MTSFIYGLGGFALFVAVSPVLQLVIPRIAPRASPVAILATASLIAHLASSLLGAAFAHPFQYWNATSVFCFGVMSYIYLFGAVYKSISLRLLLELADRPGRSIELSEISDQRIPIMFAERTDILIEGGWVVRSDDTFSATPAGHGLTARITKLRRLFAIGNSGLYDFEV